MNQTADHLISRFYYRLTGSALKGLNGAFRQQKKPGSKFPAKPKSAARLESLEADSAAHKSSDARQAGAQKQQAGGFGSTAGSAIAKSGFQSIAVVNEAGGLAASVAIHAAHNGISIKAAVVVSVGVEVDVAAVGRRAF